MAPLRTAIDVLLISVLFAEQAGCQGRDGWDKTAGTRGMLTCRPVSPSTSPYADHSRPRPHHARARPDLVLVDRGAHGPDLPTTVAGRLYVYERSANMRLACVHKANMRLACVHKANMCAQLIAWPRTCLSQISTFLSFPTRSW